MNKFLAVVVAGLVTTVLSTSSFAEAAVKVADAAKVTTTAKEKEAKAVKPTLKKLAPAAKKVVEKKAEAK
jgi:hypothetical protein